MSEQRKRRIPRSGSARQALEEGSGLFSQPPFDLPDLPQDLTLMSDDRLMRLFSEYTAWQNYAATRQAEAEVEEARADATVRYVEASAMVSHWGGSSDKVTVAKAELSLNEDVERARQVALTAYAKRKMTQVMYTNCERAVFVVSRELSRRIGSAGAERRSMRWNP